MAVPAQLDVDPAQRRISLSLKAALPKEPEPEPEAAEEAEEAPARAPRPRTTPLRGGLGGGGPLIPPPRGEGP